MGVDSKKELLDHVKKTIFRQVLTRDTEIRVEYNFDRTFWSAHEYLLFEVIKNNEVNSRMVFQIDALEQILQAAKKESEICWNEEKKNPTFERTVLKADHSVKPPKTPAE